MYKVINSILISMLAILILTCLGVVGFYVVENFNNVHSWIHSDVVANEKDSQFAELLKQKELQNAQLQAQNDEYLSQINQLQQNESLNSAEIERLQALVVQNNETISKNTSRINKFIEIINKTVVDISAEDLEGITEISKYAFYYCESLQSIEIPEGVVSIGTSALKYCINLVHIKLPNSLVDIGSNCFESCDSLQKIDLPNNLQSLGGFAFAKCGQLESIILPDSITILPAQLFNSCFLLSDVKLPNNLIEIGSAAFSFCESLKNVTIPQSVTKIGTLAFYSTALENLVFNEGLVDVGYNCLNECVQLESLTISSTIQISEKNYWFGKNENLKTLILDNASFYNNLTTKPSNTNHSAYYLCGNSGGVIKVLKSIVDDPSNTNEYLNNSAEFTKTIDGNYYIFTKI